MYSPFLDREQEIKERAEMVANRRKRLNLPPNADHDWIIAEFEYDCEQAEIIALSQRKKHGY